MMILARRELAKLAGDKRQPEYFHPRMIARFFRMELDGNSYL
jgi:hypothetical protein